MGEKLFFDPGLSANGKIACVSCHQPELSFTDGKQFSVGHSGNQLKRNTPALINLAWQEFLFWDGGVKNLESLSYAALLNADEMGVDLAELCQILNRDPVYEAAFNRAFRIDSISSAYISRALAQYLRTLVSTNARYDSIRSQLKTFSKLEKQGQEVFNENCASCHTAPLFQDNDFHHNGIQQQFTREGMFLSTGRFRITRDSTDLGKYKTPTLRNLKVTAPYMHDGRFPTLEEVLDHYQNIDSTNQIQDKLVHRISFTDEEKLALRAFLETLNENK